MDTRQGKHEIGRTAHTPYFPVFLSLKGRVCLVVGGGSVAERKVRSLLRAGACVRVVAVEITEWLRARVGEGVVSCVGELFDKEQLGGVDLVFAATSDPALNTNVAREAHGRRLWCNLATDPQEGSFILPAVLERGLLTVAISTSGASPAMARKIREKLESEFDDAWIALLDMVAIIRGVIQSRGLSSEENQELFRRVAELHLIDWIRDRDKDSAVRAICSACGPWLSIDEMNAIWDRLWKASSS